MLHSAQLDILENEQVMMDSALGLEIPILAGTQWLTLGKSLTVSKSRFPSYKV